MLHVWILKHVNVLILLYRITCWDFVSEQKIFSPLFEPLLTSLINKFYDNSVLIRKLVQSRSKDISVLISSFFIQADCWEYLRNCLSHMQFSCTSKDDDTNYTLIERKRINSIIASYCFVYLHRWKTACEIHGFMMKLENKWICRSKLLNA